MSGTRKETERAKLIQEKCQTLLTQMLRDEDNKYCVDCDAKGPRWASWNLGVFLCIRCAGIHRNLGVHISRVKSVNLDTWTPEQVISLQQMGNSRARAVYEAQLPDGFRRPQTDNALESFIRAKYEHKKYLAREWVPPSPPKVDWAKEIDDEIEKQKKKKKSAAVAGIGLVGSLSSPSDKKTSIKSSPLPAPLPKPKSSSANSPKSHRTSESSGDLLGLVSPTSHISPAVSAASQSQQANDSFTGFLSASVINGSITEAAPSNTLAKEEEDFFKQTTVSSDRDKSGKLTKDSILALYGSAPAAGSAGPVSSNSLGQFHSNQQMGGWPQNQQQQQQQQQQQTFQQNAHGLLGLNIGMQQNQPQWGNMQPGLLGQPQHQMHPQQQQSQFMQPPNSATIYNAPVMTAPAAFTPAMGHHQMMGMSPSNVGGFAQFPPMQAFQQAPSGGGMMTNAFGGQGIMATGQQIGMGFPNPSMQQAANSSVNSNAPGNLNHQFGNLNIGNVWQ